MSSIDDYLDAKFVKLDESVSRKKKGFSLSFEKAVKENEERKRLNSILYDPYSPFPKNEGQVLANEIVTLFKDTSNGKITEEDQDNILADIYHELTPKDYDYNLYNVF